MDNNSGQPAAASLPVQTLTSQPVPVSDKPLTMDPNLMSEPATPGALADLAAGIKVADAQQILQSQSYVSGPHKEAAVIRVQAPVSEYVRPSESVPKIPVEVARAGVEVSVNPEQVRLDSSQMQAGVSHAKEAAPVVIPTSTSAQPTLQLPYTPLEVKEIEKKTSIGESRHWLAVFTGYLIKKIQGITR